MLQEIERRLVLIEGRVAREREASAALRHILRNALERIIDMAIDGKTEEVIDNLIALKEELR